MLRLNLFLSLVVLSLVSVLPALTDDWQSVLSQAQSDLSKGRLDEAESGFHKAENLLEAAKVSSIDEAGKKSELKVLGFSLVDCLVGIAKVKDRKGEFAAAESTYEMGLATLVKFCENGWKNQDYADYLPGIAEMYDRHGKVDEADKSFKQLIEIRTTIAPKDEHRTIKAYESYSKFLRAHSRDNEAVPFENKISQMKYGKE